MVYSKGKILWIDDEIELLRPHILFLNEKGYEVETATNGEDAIEMVSNKSFDIVFLDEMMAGMGGITTLYKIKDIRPELPVIMVTKSEDEDLMENAIGGKISDYLTKPVNPSQILLTCKKFLEGKKITSEYVSRDYLKEFTEISTSIHSFPDENDWIEIYSKLVNWAIDLDLHPELGLTDTLYDQFRLANLNFSRFIESKYRHWLEQEKRPILSVDLVDKYLIPELESSKSVFFFVVDCLRLDQWLGMELALRSFYNIERKYYYSILPTATPYSRNGIFSGSWPNDIERRFPEIWEKWEDDDNSRNRNEGSFLINLLERRKIKFKPEPKYIKIIDPEFGKGIEQNILSYTQNKLTSIVVNFIDILAHGRSDSQILKEIAPDESAYRSLTQAWFNHSTFFNMLKTLSTQEKIKVIITTDHGSIRCMRAARVIGDRDAATNLRYKFGRNLKVDDKHAIYIKNPADYRLPNRGVTINYIVAREDYYFVYPTEYHKYLTQYRDSFQHGGISLEEMILPFIVMKPKR